MIVAGFDEQAMDLRAVRVLDERDLRRHPEDAAPEATLVSAPRLDLRLIGHRMRMNTFLGKWLEYLAERGHGVATLRRCEDAVAALEAIP